MSTNLQRDVVQRRARPLTRGGRVMTVSRARVIHNIGGFRPAGDRPFSDAGGHLLAGNVGFVRHLDNAETRGRAGFIPPAFADQQTAGQQHPSPGRAATWHLSDRSPGAPALATPSGRLTKRLEKGQ